VEELMVLLAGVQTMRVVVSVSEHPFVKGKTVSQAESRQAGNEYRDDKSE
jgi:hypothetical protein